ncbi:MAG: hypothetical protein OEV08_01880 [Nitrospira sp.]|nr:hypothetical protein [Nitrospira sp.]
MKKIYLMLIITCLLAMPYTAGAAGFDGTGSLLCAFTNASECTESEGCSKVPVEGLNLPRFVKLDFKNRKISRVEEGGRTSEMQNMKIIDQKIFLQAAEDAIEGERDGVGWTAAIMQDSGNLILTASGDNAGFIVFGACTPQ